MSEPIYALSREERAVEIKAIDSVHEVLFPLSVHSRVRVLQWAQHWARCEQPETMTRSDPFSF